MDMGLEAPRSERFQTVRRRKKGSESPMDWLTGLLLTDGQHSRMTARRLVLGHLLEHPHHGLGNKTIVNRGPPDVTGKIECLARLGGVLRHYRRAA